MVIATEADADAVTLEEVATIDRHPHVADNLVRVRGKLPATASPQLDQERAVSFHAHALGAREGQGDPPRIRARGDAEVILKLALIPIEGGVDPRPDVPVPDA